MTGKKYLTAAVFLPFFVLLIFVLPPWPFQLFVTVALSLTLLECLDLFARRSDWALPWSGRAVALAGQLAVLAAMFAGRPRLASAALAAAFVALAFYEVVAYRQLEDAPARLAVSFLAVCYTGWLMGHVMLLRMFDPDGGGPGLVAFAFLVVWLGDTAALHVGKLAGRRKLAPVISPGKSLEGLLGGLAANVLAALLGKLLFAPALPVAHAPAVGLLLGVLAHGGDLVESLFKRAVAVKDSATWIPGHGGLLDRIDSLAFSVPALYYYSVVVIGGIGS